MGTQGNMEKRKLTKAGIDKVRHIEGFSIAKYMDIIALSDAPHYTACPNPFIDGFIRLVNTPTLGAVPLVRNLRPEYTPLLAAGISIRKHGTAYDEATDDYLWIFRRLCISRRR